MPILPNDPFIVFGCDACQVVNHNVFRCYWMNLLLAHTKNSLSDRFRRTIKSTKWLIFPRKAISWIINQIRNLNNTMVLEGHVEAWSIILILTLRNGQHNLQTLHECPIPLPNLHFIILNLVRRSD